MSTATETKERPILFSGEMVRAILDGRKTQTRRIVKPQPEFDPEPCPRSPSGWSLTYGPGHEGTSPRCLCQEIRCPFGRPGDRLWVREAFSVWFGSQHWYGCERHARRRASVSNVFYRATHNFPDDDQKWVPSILMPRWASRITLEVASVRLEKLNDITEADAEAEGCGCHSFCWFEAAF